MIRTRQREKKKKKKKRPKSSTTGITYLAINKDTDLQTSTVLELGYEHCPEFRDDS
ncbi:hypothetical protein PVAG01_05663 [Phlyctema vagabunda]|uniref:Uncharacterized protein n=1 Tax=Phlyctema vagabunda TaxID=108571 RepID=A0ABR4PKP7_9HELO